ncbi:ubiquitin-conjugating enzyme/RWD-like protein, partial [Lasiosphaeria ovina]
MKVLRDYLTCLCHVLPGDERVERRAWEFDDHHHPLVSAMVVRSPLLPKMCELLRNDSIEEIGKQSDVYSAIIDFIDVVGSHPSTAPFLYQDRVLYSPEKQLAPVTIWPTPTGRFLRSHAAAAKDNTGQPVITILEKLAIPCRFFKDTAAENMKEFNAQQDQRLIKVTARVCTVAESQALARPTFAPAVEKTLPLPSAQCRAQDEIERFHRSHCVGEMADEKIIGCSHFCHEANKMDPGKMPKGRMKKLVAQVASLQTDLPKGIYVRHGSSRLDVMRVIITGPADTPYELGLFEFDLFCNQNFPLHPPRMYFRTTGHGKVAFNPNLYTNGKVCFSLLGTWNGPTWQPERSTLLQLLVSIQAMIFTAEPWYNEPGREKLMDKVSSDMYNRLIEKNTAEYAMKAWLDNRLT